MIDNLEVTTLLGPHLFHELGGGHILLNADIEVGATLVRKDKLPLACMFEAYRLHAVTAKGSTNIGYYFTSQFQTVNTGQYIATFMESKRGTAEAVEVLLKTDELVIFNYRNRGTIVVSPHVTDEVRVIFEEQ